MSTVDQEIQSQPRQPGLQITFTQHDTEDEALEAVQQALEKARADGKWMVGVWSLADGPDPQVHLRTRTTWKFNPREYGVAISQLQKNCRLEIQPPTHEPLPEANLGLDVRVPLPKADLPDTGKVDGYTEV